MLLAELDDFLVDVDGSTEGVPPATSKPKRNKSFFLILFHHLPQPGKVQLIVALLCNVDIRHCSLVVDVLHSQPALRTDVTACSEISN